MTLTRRTLEIDGQSISDGADCYVIAEISHNHQGDIDKAKQLFAAAKQCGATSVNQIRVSAASTWQKNGWSPMNLWSRQC